MASFNKFQDFVEQLLKGVHNFSSHTIKIYLTNTAPNASTHAVKADLAEITAEHGYSAGGTAITVSVSETGGTAQVDISTASVTWTASGGTIGPLRYAVVYNDTPTSPADPLIGWWDYGSPGITLQTGESFTVDPATTLFSIT